MIKLNSSGTAPDYTEHGSVSTDCRSATARIRPEQLTWAARHPETVFFCHDIETFTNILGL